MAKRQAKLERKTSEVKVKVDISLDGAGKFDIDLSETPMLGDNVSNIGAARMANARPVLVRTGNGEYTMQHFPEALDVPVYDNLAHFVRETLRRK